MIFKNSKFKHLAVLLALTSIMSFTLISCGSSTPEKNTQKNDTSASDKNSGEVIEYNNDNYVQTELTEEEKVPVLTYSSDKYYHLDKKCSHDEKDGAMTLVKKVAENMGYLPCPKCAGGTEDSSSENDK